MQVRKGGESPADSPPFTFTEFAPGKFVYFDDGTPDEVGFDYVLGPSNASKTLARLIPPLHFGRALDLGSSSGYLSLQISADEVVATDTNRRALTAGELSAVASNIKIDFRHGSLFEPVSNETFDLIVCNPPFVISPRPLFQYRDAGMHGDDISRTIISKAPDFLNNDGWFVGLANWRIRGDWRDTLIPWIAESGCDAWVVQRERLEIDEYISIWLADAGLDDSDSELIAEWKKYLSDCDAIGFGWVVLHKRDSYFPHRYLEEIYQPISEALGEAVLNYFSGADAAHDLSDEELLALAWKPSPHLESTGEILRSTVGLKRAISIPGLDWNDPDLVGTLAREYADGPDLIRELVRLGFLQK